MKTPPCRAPVRVEAYGGELVREYIRACNHGADLKTLGNFAQRLAANSVVASIHIEHEIHRSSSPRSMTKNRARSYGPAKVRSTDKGVKVQAQFKVSLPAYKVSVPSLVRLKVNDEIQLNVSLLVKPKK